MGCGQVGVEADGLPARRDRLIELALVPEYVAEVAIGIGLTRIDSDGFTPATPPPSIFFIFFPSWRDASQQRRLSTSR